MRPNLLSSFLLGISLLMPTSSVLAEMFHGLEFSPWSDWNQMETIQQGKRVVIYSLPDVRVKCGITIYEPERVSEADFDNWRRTKWLTMISTGQPLGLSGKAYGEKTVHSRKSFHASLKALVRQQIDLVYLAPSSLTDDGAAINLVARVSKALDIFGPEKFKVGPGEVNLIAVALATSAEHDRVFSAWYVCEDINLHVSNFNTFKGRFVDASVAPPGYPTCSMNNW
jgi:hypothetical protein